MGIFYNPSKIMKLIPFILTIDGISKQHKMMSQKDFLSKFKKIRQIYGILFVRSIRNVDKIFNQSLL